MRTALNRRKLRPAKDHELRRRMGDAGDNSGTELALFGQQPTDGTLCLVNMHIFQCSAHDCN